MKNKLFLFTGIFLFIFTTSCTRYVLVTTGKNITPVATTVVSEQPQVVRTQRVIVTQQSQVAYVQPEQVVNQQGRRRGGFAISGSVTQSNGIYGRSQTVSGGIAVGGQNPVMITGSYNNLAGYGGQQPYNYGYPYAQRQVSYPGGYGQSRPVVYPNQGYYGQGYGQYNYGGYQQQPYYGGYGYSGGMYNQYGQQYPYGSRPAYYYTTPYGSR